MKALKASASGPEPVQGPQPDPKAVCDEILSAGERLVAALNAEAEILRRCCREQPPDAQTRTQTRAKTDSSVQRYTALCQLAREQQAEE